MKVNLCYLTVRARKHFIRKINKITEERNYYRDKTINLMLYR